MNRSTGAILFSLFLFAIAATGQCHAQVTKEYNISFTIDTKNASTIEIPELEATNEPIAFTGSGGGGFRYSPPELAGTDNDSAEIAANFSVQASVPESKPVAPPQAPAKATNNAYVAGTLKMVAGALVLFTLAVFGYVGKSMFFSMKDPLDYGTDDEEDK